MTASAQEEGQTSDREGADRVADGDPEKKRIVAAVGHGLVCRAANSP